MRKAAALLLVLGSTLGCAPLTFSNQAEVDFARYADIALEMSGLDGALREARYLQEQLEEDSGFRSVAIEPASSDATLRVELTVEEARELLSDDPTEYEVEVRFELVAPDGGVLTDGEASGGPGTSRTQAIESALDEVVTHFLPSYRI